MEAVKVGMKRFTSSFGKRNKQEQAQHDTQLSFVLHSRPMAVPGGIYVYL